MNNLEDDTTYSFSVAASTSIGVGPYSIHVSVKTKNHGKITCYLMSIDALNSILLMYTALELGIYSGGSILLVLVMIIIGSCGVCYCYRSKLKQCTSKWYTYTE